MKRTAEDTEQTRQNLIDAAMRVLTDKGYADTRIEDIAEAAGLTRGAFYHHFDSKKAILEALLEKRYAPYARFLSGDYSPKGEGGVLGALEAHIAGILTAFADDRGLREVFYLISYKTGFVQDLADSAAGKVAAIEREVKGFERALVQAKARGELREGVEPKAAAFLLYGSLWGCVEFWVLDPEVLSLAKKAASLASMMVASLRK